MHLLTKRLCSVQKANYIQFLKGAYFDSALVALSKWSQLPVLSIVQDPLDLTAVDPRQVFAQPIVFFRLEAISILLHSRTVVHSMHAFRLRIPSRAVARVLCMAPVATQGLDDRFQDLSLGPIDVSGAIPLLKYLDLSTCGLLDADVDMILMKYRRVFYVARRITRRGMGRHGKAVRINRREEGERKGKRAEGINGGASAEQRRSSRKFSDHCGNCASQCQSTTWEARTGDRNDLAEGERTSHIRTDRSDAVVRHETCGQSSGTSTTPDAAIFIDDAITACESG